MLSVKKVRYGGTLTMLGLAGDALACPICHSDTAKLVRRGLLESFTHGPSLLAATLPFALLAIIVRAIDDWPSLRQQIASLWNGKRE